MTSKINSGKFSYQYGYDLRNRLASANITRKEGVQDVTITSSYAYNTAGIRARAEQTINGITQNRYFLLDSGHTGYSLVFEESSTLGGNIARSYIIGDDVLSQTVAGVTTHLLYDGHGSTRQLVNSNGGVTVNYAYDAYGKMLGGNPGVTDGKQSATDLLYAGEQFDPGLQMEYFRARYYDQDNGRFNRLDPFEGNNEDPQSLHKYAYCHADPVNGIDPSGNMGVLGIITAISLIIITIAVVFNQVYIRVKGKYDIDIDDLYDPKKPYRKEIIDAGKKHKIEPELIAAILAAEISDLDCWDYNFDILGFVLGNSSLGLGQITPRTITLVRGKNAARFSIAIDYKETIFFVAEYLRFMADRAEIDCNAPIDKIYYPQKIDLKKYKEHSSAWSNEMNIIMAYNYTQKPWNFRRIGNTEKYTLAIHSKAGRYGFYVDEKMKEWRGKFSN